MRTMLISMVIAILLAVVGWVNYTNLTEAFGAGSPYYGLTTNMDKWSNPVPKLIILDGITILLLIALFKLGWRKT